MPRHTTHLALCAIAFAAAAATSGFAARRTAVPTLSGTRADQSDGGDVARAAGDLTTAVTTAAHGIAGAPTEGGAGEVRRVLDAGSSGTYMDELLRGRDSSLARWPDRAARPLTVWVQPAAPFAGWRPAFLLRAREAFEEWQRVSVPVRFTFVDDSARADVHLSWVDRFDEPISGKTLWARDERWWIVSADIVLALHHRDGTPLDESAMRAMALHEVGHLMGLDHTRDAGNIMAPRVRVRELSAADRATVRLLYSVPPGRVR